MSKAIGGYVRRKDRIKGVIVHLQEKCEWCGENYAEIRKGTVKHNMNVEHHWPTLMPMTRFEQFDVS